MQQQLTPNFTLSEFTTSQTAARANISNDPTPQVLKALTNTATQLELVRTLLGTAVLISSGYRSPAVNKAVGGAGSSQHLTGEAADFTAPRFGTPREIVAKIKASNIDYDQLILEFDRWVHISFKQSTNRKQALIIDNQGTRVFS